MTQEPGDMEWIVIEAKVRRMVKDLIEPTVRRALDDREQLNKLGKESEIQRRKIDEFEFLHSKGMKKLGLIDDVNKRILDTEAGQKMVEGKMTQTAQTLKADMEALSGEIQRKAELIKNFEKQIDNMNFQMQTFNTSFQEFQDDVKRDLEKQQNQTFHAFDEAKEVMASVKEVLGDLGTQQKRVNLAMGDIAAEIVTINKTNSVLRMRTEALDLEKANKSSLEELQREIEKVHERVIAEKAAVSKKIKTVKNLIEVQMPYKQQLLIPEWLHEVLDSKARKRLCEVETQRYKLWTDSESLGNALKQQVEAAAANAQKVLEMLKTEKETKSKTHGSEQYDRASNSSHSHSSNSRRKQRNSRPHASGRGKALDTEESGKHGSEESGDRVHELVSVRGSPKAVPRPAALHGRQHGKDPASINPSRDVEESSRAIRNREEMNPTPQFQSPEPGLSPTHSKTSRHDQGFTDSFRSRSNRPAEGLIEKDRGNIRGRSERPKETDETPSSMRSGTREDTEVLSLQRTLKKVDNGESEISIAGIGTLQEDNTSVTSRRYEIQKEGTVSKPSLPAINRVTGTQDETNSSAAKDRFNVYKQEEASARPSPKSKTRPKLMQESLEELTFSKDQANVFQDPPMNLSKEKDERSVLDSNRDMELSSSRRPALDEYPERDEVSERPQENFEATSEEKVAEKQAQKESSKVSIPSSPLSHNPKADGGVLDSKSSVYSVQAQEFIAYFTDDSGSSNHSDAPNFGDLPQQIEALSQRINTECAVLRDELNERYSEFLQDLRQNTEACNALAKQVLNECAGLHNIRKREKIDVMKDLKEIQEEMAELKGQNGSFLGTLERFAELIAHVVEVSRIGLALDIQDEEDRESIALMGIKENGPQSPSAESKPPVMSLDKQCLSCTGQGSMVLSAFKLACLAYAPTPLTYRNATFQRKDLREVQKRVLETAWGKVSSSDPWNRLKLKDVLEAIPIPRVRGNASKMSPSAWGSPLVPIYSEFPSPDLPAEDTPSPQKRALSSLTDHLPLLPKASPGPVKRRK